MKELSQCLIYLLILTSCLNRSQKSSERKIIEEINISDSYKVDKKGFLSEIADDISYVRLETDTNCLINKIRDPESNIQFCEDRIFINDENNLFSFDYTGKFLNKIGRIGRGPGELIRIDDFTILPKDSLIALFSHANRKIYYYTFSNKFVKSINIDFWPTSLSTLNKDFLVFGSAKGRRNETDYYTLTIMNKEGGIVNHLISNQIEEQVEKKEKLGLTTMCHFYSYFDTLSYWEFQYDTIYRIYNEWQAVPKYYINSGPKKLPFELLIETKVSTKERDKYVKIWNIFESKRFVFLKVGYEIYLKHIVYDKQSKVSYNIDYTYEKRRYLDFYNDFDGGMTFWPLGNVSENKMFSLFYGSELKKKLSKMDETNFDEKQKALSHLLINTNLLDNPIIMIVSLKE